MRFSLLPPRFSNILFVLCLISASSLLIFSSSNWGAGKTLIYNLFYMACKVMEMLLKNLGQDRIKKCN
jgi:hypothetical protein